MATLLNAQNLANKHKKRGIWSDPPPRPGDFRGISHFFTFLSNETPTCSRFNIKTKDQNSPNCIEVNKELVTDCAEIPNKFNDYFSSVADKILEKNKTPTLKTFDKYLGDFNQNIVILTEMLRISTMLEITTEMIKTSTDLFEISN